MIDQSEYWIRRHTLPLQVDQFVKLSCFCSGAVPPSNLGHCSSSDTPPSCPHSMKLLVVLLAFSSTIFCQPDQCYLSSVLLLLAWSQSMMVIGLSNESLACRYGSEAASRSSPFSPLMVHMRPGRSLGRGSGEKVAISDALRPWHPYCSEDAMYREILAFRIGRSLSPFICVKSAHKRLLYLPHSVDIF